MRTETTKTSDEMPIPLISESEKESQKKRQNNWVRIRKKRSYSSSDSASTTTTSFHKFQGKKRNYYHTTFEFDLSEEEEDFDEVDDEVIVEDSSTLRKSRRIQIRERCGDLVECLEYNNQETIETQPKERRGRKKKKKERKKSASKKGISHDAIDNKDRNSSSAEEKNGLDVNNFDAETSNYVDNENRLCGNSADNCIHSAHMNNIITPSATTTQYGPKSMKELLELFLLRQSAQAQVNQIGRVGTLAMNGITREEFIRYMHR